jgi:putative endopeptidase
MLVRFRLALTAPLLAVVVSSVAFAQRGASHVLDRANLDTTCAPCKDFYQFANGTWLAKHTISPDKSGLGSFGMLGDKNQEVVQKIVIDDANLVNDREAKAGSNDYKIGTFYLACMDTVALDRPGSSRSSRRSTRSRPRRPLTTSSSSSGRRVTRRWRRRPRRRRDRSVLARSGNGSAQQQDHHSLREPGGLTLNREDYVRRRARDSTRTECRRPRRAVTELLGENSTQAGADAKTIFDLETAIAKITIPQADMRDPVATYHKMTVGAVSADHAAPELDAIPPAATRRTPATSTYARRASSRRSDSLIAAAPVDD